MFNVAAKKQKNLETNSDPQSEVIWESALCLKKTYVTKSLARVSESIVWYIRIKIAYFVRWSTITKISVNPSDIGSYLIKSIKIDSYG